MGESFKKNVYSIQSWCWWTGFQVGQHYKVTMCSHCHKSVPVLIWPWTLLGCKTTNKQNKTRCKSTLPCRHWTIIHSQRVPILAQWVRAEIAHSVCVFSLRHIKSSFTEYMAKSRDQVLKHIKSSAICALTSCGVSTEQQPYSCEGELVTPDHGILKAADQTAWSKE